MKKIKVKKLTNKQINLNPTLPNPGNESNDGTRVIESFKEFIKRTSDKK